MKRILKAFLTMAAVGGAVGCGSAADEFRQAVPRPDEVEVKTPARAGAGLSERSFGLEGQQSELYQFTRGATVTVNGATVSVLGLVKAITDHAPTSLTETEAVWGPHSEALSPTEWKLTVSKSGATSYSYALGARAKADQAAAFITILSGVHSNATGQRDYGNGEFLLDWDNAQQLPEHGDELGSVTITYSRATGTNRVAVDAAFVQVRDGDTGGRIDADYQYEATPGAGGSFEFGLKKDIHGGSSLALPESFTVKSRWLETGAGRSDARVTGGNLDHAETANECWDVNFLSQFRSLTYDATPAQNYGVEAEDCAIQGAEYSDL